jgi:hypothetical protein
MRCHEDIGSVVVLSDSGVCLPCVSGLASTSAVGDAGLDVEKFRGVVSWLALRGYSLNGKPSQLTTKLRASAGPFRVAAVGVGGEEATGVVSPSASGPSGGDTVTAASSICRGRTSSMTDRTLRRFDSALRALPPGGEEDGRRGGEDDDDRGGSFVGVLVVEVRAVVRSELDVDAEDDVDGTASSHSDDDATSG